MADTLSDEHPGRTDIPTGTVTFLFTDIEGSTLLLERLREQYATVLADQRDLLRAAFANWNGHEIDTQGDAFFVAFPRALDAVNCVIEAQRALAAHPWPQGVTVRVRMGLHTGEPILARTGYIGMDVHRAARLASAGHGGQVLLSQTTRDLIFQDLPVGATLSDLGAHKLKDIRYPQQIFQLDLEGLPAEFAPLKTLATGEEPPTPGDPPFKGLQYFDQADADLFFGREAMTTKLVEIVCRQRFLAVIGASGSGKSSVVRAGLAPGLKRGQSRGARWQIYLLTPTAHPLEALATNLTRASESVTATATLMDDLAHDPRSLHLYLRRTLTPAFTLDPSPFKGEGRAEGRVLLIVDQFEELFTLCRSETERRAFVDNLLYAVQAEGAATTVVIALRADFYEHLAQFAALREAVAKQQEYIGPMSAAELRQAIEEPARRGGWEFAPGLVDLMLHDVGAGADQQPEPGALPLLSHALLETWKRRRGNMMTLKGYSESGGVRGAIARTAETVFYQELTPEQQPIARGIFLRLTELGEGTQDTRRRASLDELIPPAPFGNPTQLEDVLVKLADARLITTGEGTVQVAHEALIREWTTLREWLTQNREGLRLHRHLTEAAQEWELLERDPGALYRGARLAQAIEWAEANPRELNAQEQAFLEASKRLAEREEAERETQRRRELEAAQKLAETEKQRAEEQTRSASRLRRRAVYLSGALLIAALLAIVAMLFGQQSNSNAQQAQLNLHNAQTAEARALGEAQTRATAEAVAVSEREKAEQQARLATSRELAAAATSNLAVDPERSILLAVQAIHVDNIWEAQNALHQAILASRLRASVSAHAKSVYGVAISPDGRRFASAGMDGTVKVWSLDDSGLPAGDAPALTLSNPVDYQVPTDTAGQTVAFSQDGSRLAAVGPKHTAEIWDASTGQLLQTLTGHSGDVYSVAFSPDGKRMATTSADQTARVWDVLTGQSLIALSGHTDLVYVAAFSPDGKYLVTSSEDISLKFWDLEAQPPTASRELFSLPQSSKDDVAGALAFSTDGKRLAVASQVVKIWEIEAAPVITATKLLLTLSGHTNSVNRLAFTPDGGYLISGSADGKAKVWDTTTGQEVFTLAGNSGGVTSIALGPDGNRLLTAHNNGTVKVWDLSPTGNQEWFNVPGHYGQFSPDGKRFITSGGLGEETTEWHLWDVLPMGVKEMLSHQVNQGAPISALAFSPNLDRFVTVGADKTVKIWDTGTGKQLQSFPLSGHTDLIFGLAISRDGTRIATGSDDGTVRIWDLATGKSLFTLSGHSGYVRGLAFNPDGTLLASASFDGTARIWDARTGQLLHELTGHDEAVIRVEFSPDGSRLTTTSQDTTARLWNVSTGEKILTLAGHTGTVFFATFSPDGTRIATGSVDGTVKVWDASSGQPLLSFPGLFVMFSPDGKRLVTSSTTDRRARGFYLDTDDLLALARSRLTRALTAEECQKFLHVAQCP